ncbi:YdhG-like domain-containing protein, partial [Dysosmobacter welbionis]
ASEKGRRRPAGPAPAAGGGRRPGAAGGTGARSGLRRRAVRRRHGGPAGLCLPPLHGRGLEGPAGQRHDPLPLRSAVQSPPPHTPETDRSRSPRRGRRPGLRHRAGGGGGAVPAVPGRPIRRTLRRSRVPGPKGPFLCRVGPERFLPDGGGD